MGNLLNCGILPKKQKSLTCGRSVNIDKVGGLLYHHFIEECSLPMWNKIYISGCYLVDCDDVGDDDSND